MLVLSVVYVVFKAIFRLLIVWYIGITISIKYLQRDFVPKYFFVCIYGTLSII